MKLPEAVSQTLARYVQAVPVPHGEPGDAIEEQVRQWTSGAVEQVVHEHPGQGWGSKSAGAGRPRSKDSIANNQIQPGALLNWDLVTGAGTGNGAYVGGGSDSTDITGQVFVPVSGIDHLGVAIPPQEPDEPTQPNAGAGGGPDVASFIADVRASLGRIEQGQSAHTAAILQLAALVSGPVPAPAPSQPVVFPSYTGKVSLPFVGSQTITLDPKL